MKKSLAILIVIALSAPIAQSDDPHVPPPPVVKTFAPPPPFVDSDFEPLETTWISKGVEIVVVTFKHKRQSKKDFERDHKIHVGSVQVDHPADPEKGFILLPPKPNNSDEGIGSLPV